MLSINSLRYFHCFHDFCDTLLVVAHLTHPSCGGGGCRDALVLVVDVGAGGGDGCGNTGGSGGSVLER